MPQKTRKPKRRPSALEYTAYHEAGHAVAAIALRAGVERVSVVPDEVPDSVGHCLCKTAPREPDPVAGRDSRSALRARDEVERAIMISLAGGIAEARWKGHGRGLGADRDLQNAYGLAFRVCADLAEA
jgi:ATP-dependent Zn protease